MRAVASAALMGFELGTLLQWGSAKYHNLVKCALLQLSVVICGDYIC